MYQGRRGGGGGVPIGAVYPRARSKYCITVKFLWLRCACFVTRVKQRAKTGRTMARAFRTRHNISRLGRRLWSNVTTDIFVWSPPAGGKGEGGHGVNGGLGVGCTAVRSIGERDVLFCFSSAFQ